MKKIVIALGGNALIKHEQIGKFEEQLHNVRMSCKEIGEAEKKHYQIVLTHGNGPQVGNLEIQMKEAKKIVPAMPLDVEGAMTQAQIGYMIQQSLKEFLPHKKIATIITQVMVSENDSAFNSPTKPIGPSYSKKEALALQKKGIKLVFQKGKGFRKVVPSPMPKKIIEIETIKELIRRRNIVICCGGGGIPVIEKNGKIQGTDAVIDKDHASQLLANSLGAQILVILTDTEFVKINYGTVQEKNIHQAKAKLLKNYLMHGEFEEGSMKPKIEACLEFLRKGGRKAIITSLNKLIPALEEKTGTIITR
ncbi:MAG: carbamate kinase [archaeon]|nr:carbamate kinase [archaeon]